MLFLNADQNFSWALLFTSYGNISQIERASKKQSLFNVYFLSQRFQPHLDDLIYMKESSRSMGTFRELMIVLQLMIRAFDDFVRR